MSSGITAARAEFVNAFSSAVQTARTVEASARSVLSTDPTKASALAQSAASLVSAQVGDGNQRELIIATSEWLRGEADLRLNRVTEARPLLSDAYKRDVRLSGSEAANLKADVLVSRGFLENNDGDVQSALTDFLSAYQIYSSLKNTRRQASTLENIGILYGESGDYTRALTYYEQSRATFTGLPTLDLSLANNRASALAELGRYAAAALGFEQALRIANTLGSVPLKVQVLNNLAFNQIKDGQYRAAQLNLDRALSLARGSEFNALLPSVLATGAQLSLRQGRTGEAETRIDFALKARDPRTRSGQDIELYRTAYQVHKAAGNYAKSLQEFEVFQELDHDHRALMASASSALMAARFDFDNQNSRIALLKQGQLRRDIALSRLRARQTQIIVFALLVLISFLVLFFLLYLRSARHSRDRLRKANTVLNDTNLKLERALDAKTQFLATTSHEIRTPLNGILGMTEVLLADQQTSGWVRQRLSLIHEAGHAMRGLVDDLLDMSKMDAAEIVIQRDVIDLPTLLWEAHHFWISHAESAGLTLLLDISRAPVMIVEDGRRLRQILFNLLSNAVKFTAAGSISMSAESAQSPNGERLVIRVVDTGIGIPEESREAVFEKFTQLDSSISRKYSGTGLGLSIARALARAMGGDIALEPGSSVGSTFFVTLPLERVAATRAAWELGIDEIGGLDAMRVVIVEPNPIRQSALRATLERHVETITFKATVAEVIDELRSEVVHVVITSVPKGGWDDREAGTRELQRLEALAKTTGVHLVVIMDEDLSIATLGLSGSDVSRLARPVSGGALVEHLDGLQEKAQPLSSLRA